jgi:hypothetical protein
MAVAQSLAAPELAVPERSRPGPARRPWVIVGRATVLATVAVGLFLAYLRMSRTQHVDADGASQALQGWDLLHGNLLLGGWTVSDVSFYTNEVVLFAIVEAINGLNADAIHIVAAILYTLLSFAVALLARGHATGRAAVARVVVALAVMLVPASGTASWILLGSADHTGTGVPLLLTWLVLDRGLDHGLARCDASRPQAPRWLPYVVAVMLAWGQIADPLVLFIGVLPLVGACAARIWRAGLRRPRLWRGTDARLVAAGIGSVLLTQAFLLAVRTFDGYHIHGVPVGLVGPSRLLDNLRIAVHTLALDFGAYFPDRHGPLDVAMGAVRLLGLVAVIAAVLVVGIRMLRGRSESRVDEVLALGIGINIGAYVVSTIPTDLMSARQVTAVLTMGAALVGRVWGPRLASLRWLPGLVAVMALVYGGEFVARTAEPPVPPANATLAAWLESRNLQYGLSGFWTSNDISVITGGRVRIAPVVGDKRVYGYRWLSSVEWYDAKRHDARFVIIDRLYPPHGTEAGAVASFGEPKERHDIGRHTILVYDHNLLVDLPADCVPGHSRSMADCGKTRFLRPV